MSPHWGVYEIETRVPGETEWRNGVHVAPKYGPEHEFVGDHCWCGPTVEKCLNGNYLFVHRDCN